MEKFKNIKCCCVIRDALFFIYGVTQDKKDSHMVGPISKFKSKAFRKIYTKLLKSKQL